MVNFWKIVNRVIAKSDVVLQVIDSRIPELSRNLEIEAKIKRQEKKLINVLNKSDIGKIKTNIENAVYVSAKKKQGTSILKRKILYLGGKQKKEIVVGVVGYPNTGKSSVINALAGKSKATTSAKSGFTRGLQFVRAGSRIVLIDTPGVIPFKEKDEFKQALIGAKDSAHIQDPENVALHLIEVLQGKIEKYYGIDEKVFGDEKLEQAGQKLKILAKGGGVDIQRTSRKLISDWQRGVIN
ncbi:MAG: GTPase [Candidatus Nanoarchaeia archaeon]